MVLDRCIQSGFDGRSTPFKDGSKSELKVSKYASKYCVNKCFQRNLKFQASDNKDQNV